MIYDLRAVNSDINLSGYTPQQIVKAYNLSDNNSGGGVVVACIDFVGNRYIQSNINKFSAMYGLKKTRINYIGTNVNVGSGFDFSAYIEPSADTQWVHAIAQDAELLVVHAPEYSIDGAVNAVETALMNGADIILQTFQAAFEESYIDSLHIYDSDAVFIASSGDYGAGAFFPSCFPQCISVGGTSVKIDNSGRRISEETVWHGTGGGICSYFKIPEYQSKFYPINEITNGIRGVPDVSFFADPDPGYSVYHSSVNDSFGWYSAGGTSIAAAVVAGIVAKIISSGKVAQKRDILNYLYKAAGETKYSNEYKIFNDIISGNNGEFSAVIGYDLCTGLGSLQNI